MQRLAKEGFLLAFVVTGLIFCVFMLLLTTKTITNVSAVEANVGVYSDSNCAEDDKVDKIDWGTLTPGEVKNIVVYIRNEVKEPIYLILNKTNWTPPEASDYMTLRWNYFGQRLNPYEALRITLTLSVSPSIRDISSFSFTIVIEGTDRLPGDVNGDGKVGSRDLAALGIAYGSRPGDPNWNPAADFDANGVVGSRDLTILGKNYGQPYS